MKNRTNIQVEHSTLIILKKLKKQRKKTYDQLLIELINSIKITD